MVTNINFNTTQNKFPLTNSGSVSDLNSNSGDYSSYSDRYRPNDRYGGMEQYGRVGRMPGYGYDRSTGQQMHLGMDVSRGSSQDTRYMGR